MSPTSAAIERLAALYGKPVLEVLEFFIERAGMREYVGGATRTDADREAMVDVEDWLRGGVK